LANTTAAFPNMASRRGRKRPKPPSISALDKHSRIARRNNPASHDRETIVWTLGVADLDGPWGWCDEKGKVWCNDILPALRAFESMTWAGSMQGSGGRTSGGNSQFVEVGKLTKRARDRLAAIGQSDVAQLFSLRLKANVRIYGIRDRRSLKLLWYDKHHGVNARAVYPVGDR